MIALLHDTLIFIGACTVLFGFAALATLIVNQIDKIRYRRGLDAVRRMRAKQ